MSSAPEGTQELGSCPHEAAHIPARAIPIRARFTIRTLLHMLCMIARRPWPHRHETSSRHIPPVCRALRRCARLSQRVRERTRERRCDATALFMAACSSADDRRRGRTTLGLRRGRRSRRLATHAPLCRRSPGFVHGRPRRAVDGNGYTSGGEPLGRVTGVVPPFACAEPSSPRMGLAPERAYVLDPRRAELVDIDLRTPFRIRKRHALAGRPQDMAVLGLDPRNAGLRGALPGET